MQLQNDVVVMLLAMLWLRVFLECHDSGASRRPWATVQHETTAILGSLSWPSMIHQNSQLKHKQPGSNYHFWTHYANTSSFEVHNTWKCERKEKRTTSNKINGFDYSSNICIVGRPNIPGWDSSSRRWSIWVVAMWLLMTWWNPIM